MHCEQEVHARRQAHAHVLCGRPPERVLVIHLRDEFLGGCERLLVVPVRGNAVVLCARGEVACLVVEVVGSVDERVDGPECAFSALVTLADRKLAETSGKHSISGVGGDVRWALLRT